MKAIYKGPPGGYDRRRTSSTPCSLWVWGRDSSRGTARPTRHRSGTPVRPKGGRAGKSLLKGRQRDGVPHALDDAPGGGILPTESSRGDQKKIESTRYAHRLRAVRL